MSPPSPAGPALVTIYGRLGDAAAWPVAAAIRHFRDEFEWHITHPDEAQTRNFGLAHYADALIPA